MGEDGKVQTAFCKQVNKLWKLGVLQRRKCFAYLRLDVQNAFALRQVEWRALKEVLDYVFIY